MSSSSSYPVTTSQSAPPPIHQTLAPLTYNTLDDSLVPPPTHQEVANPVDDSEESDDSEDMFQDEEDEHP